MTVVVGEQIQAGTGDWTGNPTAYTYQWQWSDDGISSDGNLPGETRSDHIVTSDDLGLWLRVGVTATNAGGSSTVSYSEWVGPVGVYVPPGVPVETPVYSGAFISHVRRKKSRGRNHLVSSRRSGRF